MTDDNAGKAQGAAEDNRANEEPSGRARWPVLSLTTAVEEDTMHTRTLGQGLQVSAIGLGAMGMSQYVSENCRRASDVSGDESINVTAWRLPHAPRVVRTPWRPCPTVTCPPAGTTWTGS